MLHVPMNVKTNIPTSFTSHARFSEATRLATRTSEAPLSAQECVQASAATSLDFPKSLQDAIVERWELCQRNLRLQSNMWRLQCYGAWHRLKLGSVLER